MSTSRTGRKLPSRLAPGSIQRMREMRRNGSSIDEIAATFGISKSTAHEHVRDIHVFPQEQILPDFQGRDILPPLDPMVPSYGADYPVTPTRSSDATRTK